MKTGIEYIQSEIQNVDEKNDHVQEQGPESVKIEER